MGRKDAAYKIWSRPLKTVAGFGDQRTDRCSCVIVLSHWPHVAEQVRQQVCVAHSSREPMTSLARKCVATCCSTCVQCERFQQHSRTQVEQQVAQLVASVKGLGHKLPNLLLNVSEIRKLRASAASSILRRHVESHCYSLPIRKWNS